jgi:hypothetical protein
MPFFGKCGCSGRKGDLEEINILNYAHNNLTHVPEEIILHERTLEELYLDANRICELPRVFTIFLLIFIASILIKIYFFQSGYFNAMVYVY